MDEATKAFMNALEFINYSNHHVAEAHAMAAEGHRQAAYTLDSEKTVTVDGAPVSHEEMTATVDGVPVSHKEMLDHAMLLSAQASGGTAAMACDIECEQAEAYESMNGVLKAFESDGASLNYAVLHEAAAEAHEVMADVHYKLCEMACDKQAALDAIDNP